MLWVLQDMPAVASKCTVRSCTPVNIEESSSSFKSIGPPVSTQNGKDYRSSSSNEEDVSASHVPSKDIFLHFCA